MRNPSHNSVRLGLLLLPVLAGAGCDIPVDQDLFMAWSPDNRALAAIDADGSQRLLLALFPEPQWRAVGAPPSGRALVRPLWVEDALGNALLAAFDTAESGEGLAGVRLFTIAGAEQRFLPLAVTPGEDLQAAAATPERRGILYARGDEHRWSVWELDLISGAETLAARGEAETWQVLMARNGRQWAVLESGLRRGGQPATRVTTYATRVAWEGPADSWWLLRGDRSSSDDAPGRIRLLDWTADGSGLLLQEGSGKNGRRWLLRVRDGQLRQLPEDGRPADESRLVSPDGRIGLRWRGDDRLEWMSMINP